MRHSSRIACIVPYDLIVHVQRRQMGIVVFVGSLNSNRKHPGSTVGPTTLSTIL